MPCSLGRPPRPRSPTQHAHRSWRVRPSPPYAATPASRISAGGTAPGSSVRGACWGPRTAARDGGPRPALERGARSWTSLTGRPRSRGRGKPTEPQGAIIGRATHSASGKKAGRSEDPQGRQLAADALRATTARLTTRFSEPRRGICAGSGEISIGPWTAKTPMRYLKTGPCTPTTGGPRRGILPPRGTRRSAGRRRSGAAPPRRKPLGAGPRRAAVPTP
mmetsp:Transcript_42648/g.96006  ORF Transcript_42648/g.96006 Transcript_42648/m.96006 type:complete len:220 (+) Transcript_42648:1339-1998(+)